MKTISMIVIAMALLTTACGRLHDDGEELLTSQDVKGRYGDTLPDGQYYYLGTELTEDGQPGRVYGPLEDSTRSLRTKVGPYRRIICGPRRCIWVWR